MRKTLRLLPYGSQVNSVLVDRLMLEHVSKILNSSKGELIKAGRANFWHSFIELSNFSELICLQETLSYMADDGSKSDPAFTMIFDIGEVVRSFSGILRQFSFMTIDDLQKKRVFNRWIAVRNAGAEIEPDEELWTQSAWPQYKQFLGGCLAEELMTTPYFPSSAYIKLYTKASPLRLDVSLYSLLIEAYTNLRESEATSIQMRNFIGGVRQPSIPPITAIILSKISSPKDYMEELLHWRNKFEPLRKRISELKSLANSDIPMKKWVKEYRSLSNEISKFSRGFDFIDSRIEASKIDPIDFADIKATISNPSIDSSLDIKKVIGLGIDRIIQIIKRRKIQPLPSLKKKLKNLGKLSPYLEKVYGIDFNHADYELLNRFQRPVDELLKNQNLNTIKDVLKSAPAPVPDFRSSIDAIKFTERFNFNKTLREFSIVIKANTRKNYSSSDYLIDTGFMHLDFDDAETAEQLFKRALELGSPTPEALDGLGMVRHKAGQLEEARNYLQAALSLKATSTDILLDMGKILVDEGKYDTAIPYLLRAVEIDSGFELAWLSLGACYLHLDRYDEAKRAYETVLRLNFYLDEALFGLGRVEESRGDIDRAIQLYRQAVKENPRETRYWIKLGHSLWDNNSYSLSSDAFAMALKLDCPEANKIIQLLASALYLAARYQEAANVFEQIIENKYDDENSHMSYGYTLYELKRYDEAIREFYLAYKADPTQARYVITIAQIHLELEESEKARKLLFELSTDFPENAEVWFWIGKCSWEEEKIAEAISYFRRAIKLGFSRPDELYHLAVQLDQHRDYEHAVTLYKLELQVSTDNAECQANLAADLCELERVEEALGYAQKACELAPNDLTNLNILAGVLLSLNHYREAKEVFSKIVEIGDDSDPFFVNQAKQVLEQLDSG